MILGLLLGLGFGFTALLGFAAFAGRAYKRGHEEGSHDGYLIGYRAGSQKAGVIAKRAMHDLTDAHCLQMAELVYSLTGTEIPESPEVVDERERRS